MSCSGGSVDFLVSHTSLYSPLFIYSFSGGFISYFFDLCHSPPNATHNIHATRHICRIEGGIGVILKFWPIKAYRPCPKLIENGGFYQRSGQGLDEIAFGRDSKYDPME
jgi:hypothetical protein